MVSSKEQCFQDAMQAYEEATGQSLGVQHQQPWRQLSNGTWEQASSWQSALNTLINRGQQFRVPDMTIGGNTVVDLKFTRADGTVDGWRTQPGAANGNTQLEDYNDINSQQNPNFDNDDPSLDPESCNCPGRGAQRVTVPVYAIDPYGTGEMVLVPERYAFQGGGQAIRNAIRLTPEAMQRLSQRFGFRPFSGLSNPFRVSSERYKSNIAKADLKADRLLDVEVKRFTWTRDGREDLGFIAEEVEEVLPELFVKDADLAGIRADHLPFYLLELIKAQQARIEALEARLGAVAAAPDKTIDKEQSDD